MGRALRNRFRASVHDGGIPMKTILRLILKSPLLTRWLVAGLAKLEWAVGLFAAKQAARATAEGYPVIATWLTHHAKEEFGHSRLLASLVVGNVYPKPRARWIREEPWRDYSEVTPGLVIPQITSYGPAKFFFDNRSPSEFPFSETLIFMGVLEEEAERFYRTIASIADGDLRRVALTCAGDEEGHAHQCLATSRELQPYEFRDSLAHWRTKLRVALLLAPIGLLILISEGREDVQRYTS